MLSIFSYACWLSVYLLWKNVYLDLLPILKIVLYWVIWAIYVFWILTPYWSCQLQITSQSVGCIFVLLTVSLTVQKLSSLVRPYLFSFAFFSFSWETDSKTYCYELCWRMFWLGSLLGILWFQVLHLDLWIHFEFLSYMFRGCVLILLIYVSYLVFWTPFIEDTVFSCLLCHRLIDHNCMGLFLGCLRCSVDPHICFCTSTILFWLL